jgi:RNA polymerase sigma factor (sigma-70 family)
MIITNIMSEIANNDTELVSASLSGNREAFGQIVLRYQSLICSLAYSATGSLTASEDLAQETFVTAWKQLAALREREKLRGWLCGIARNLINNSLRRQGREPSHRAESLEDLSESHSAEPLPGEQAISNEEQAILWRSLEKIPEIYREPLVLFYREHQSVETVAQNLDLSEDAVKQRLSRGRKLLHEQVLAFVEGALVRTSPGQAFTISVLAALPLTLTTSAKAATLGAAAAKGSVAAKAAVSAGVAGALLSPLLSVLGSWVQYRMWLEGAASERERALIKRYVQKLLLVVGFGVAASLALVCGAMKFMNTYPAWYAAALTSVAAVYILTVFQFARGSRAMLLQFQAERSASGNQSPVNPWSWEYRSRRELFGLPWIHIRWNCPGDPLKPVKAWIAAGSYAIGGIFALGGVAIAPVSIGGLAVGLLPWGGVALGVVAFGGLALGGWVFGGFAMGWQSYGGCAIALNAAQGGLAIARDFAIGGAAYAAQADPAFAAPFFQTSFFFRWADFVSRHIVWLNLVWLLPIFAWRRMHAKSANKP